MFVQNAVVLVEHAAKHMSRFELDVVGVDVGCTAGLNCLRS